MKKPIFVVLLAALALPPFSQAKSKAAPKCDAVCRAVKKMLPARLNYFEGYRGVKLGGEDTEWKATFSLPGSMGCEIHGEVGDVDANWDCPMGYYMEFEANAKYDQLLSSVKAALSSEWVEMPGLTFYYRNNAFSRPGIEDAIVSVSLDKPKDGRQRLHFYINSSDAK